ncbi:MAG TPA: hypothetical protein VN018_02585 [Brevundimonas sp.]|nr:hypothetical protein [Brevundimonas sp.]
MDEWPWDLLPPRTDRWTLQGVAINGGVSVGGVSRLTRTDGGGLWVGEQSFLLTEPVQIKTARALEGLMDGGSGLIVAWSFEEPFAPAGAEASLTPYSDGSAFSDGGMFVTAPTGTTLAADAALRATVLSVTMEVGALQGGEQFSIVHPVMGWRRYRVVRVEGGQVTIRPPLREASSAGAVLRFDRVGCVCRLANPQEFMGALGIEHSIDVTARWVEAF